jgi:hypothetical protein
MVVAIFGVMLLLNRQSGGLFSDLFLFILPIPMTAYAALYGGKSGLPVFVCMALMSFFCGDYSSFFYAICEAFTGWAFGTCLNQKKDPGKTMLLLMAIQAAVEVVSGVVLAGLFGINLDTTIQEMQNQVVDAVSKSAALQGQDADQMVQAVTTMFSTAFLFRLYVISMIFLGVLQGFVIYELSLIILRRLRFPVQKPKPVSTFYPAKWTGYLGLGLFVLYMATSSAAASGTSALVSAAQTAGICGYLYLVVFGFVGSQQYLTRVLGWAKLPGILIPLVLVFIFPFLLVFVGCDYICLSLHSRIDQAYEARQKHTPAKN